MQPHSVHFQDQPGPFGHPLPKALILQSPSLPTSPHSSPFSREALLTEGEQQQQKMPMYILNKTLLSIHNSILQHKISLETK